MKKIALLELQEHQEVLYGLIDLLLIQAVEIYVCAPAYMHEQLKPEWLENEQLHWTNKLPEENIPQFIRRVKNQLEVVDLIVFTTLVNHFAFFAQQSFTPPTVLLIHKGNAFFAPQSNLSIRNLKDVLRFLRSLWRREDFFRKKLLKKNTYLSFTDPLIEAYMLPLVPAFAQLMPALPFTYFTPTLPQLNTPIQIIVPGTVSALTRDFDLLFAALQKADTRLNTSITLTFLGNASGPRAVLLFDLAQNNHFQNINIQTFSEMLPEQEYQKKLQTADFLLLPLKEQIQFGTTREWYGKTSISGGVNDMLRFGKPTLLPAFYPLDPALQSLSERFLNAENLADLLLKWVNERYYLSLAGQAPVLLTTYTKAQRSHTLMEILKPALNFIKK
ncbi:hypothetical protein [Haliscomenobacter sp.]|uniref:hypothetical protein n=1 Tax=Haliscomenobacter sp. TaxID=2717303 RepID=UPI003BA9E58F